MTGIELTIMLAKYFGYFGLFILGYIEGRKDKQKEIDRKMEENR